MFVMYVVLCIFNDLNVYLIGGRQCDMFVDFEEVVVQEGFDFLDIWYKLKIEDINLEIRERYKYCVEFYKVLREDLKFLFRREGMVYLSVFVKNVGY